MGSNVANLRANDRTRQAFPLFTAESRLERAPGLLVRAGVALTQRIGVEAGLTITQPTLHASVTADVEGAPSLSIEEQFDQYFIDGSVVIAIPELGIGDRLVPFASAGAGYLRQLHEGQTLVDEGQVYHFGGGVKYWLWTRPAGIVRAMGLRGDVRGYVMRRGFSLEDGARSHPAIAGSVFVVF